MENFFEIYKSNDTLRNVGQFMIVGMLGTLIDISLFAALHIVLGFPTLLANTISYSAGIINNFFFHRYWTFADRPRKAAEAQFVQFAAVSLSALVLNNLLVVLLADPFNLLVTSVSLGALFAKLCATGVGMVWNFLANHLWTFGKSAQGGSR